MLTKKSIHRWYLIHRWSSLIPTVFLLVLCLTGLPLIFHEEIDRLSGSLPEPAALPADTPAADLDRIAGSALKARPGEVIQYVTFDEDQPLVGVLTAPALDSGFDQSHYAVFDARTGEPFEVPPFNEGVVWIIYKIHTELYLGLTGKLFLGFNGVLLVVSLVSGTVLYGPFMRKLPFATIRASRGERTRWLDLHNLLGIVILAWLLVVGLTGIINTLAEQIMTGWRTTQLVEMTARYRELPLVSQPGSLEKAISAARAAAPQMEPYFVAFPGTGFSSKHHYAVFMRGDAALTKRLLTPAIVDAKSGELTAMRAMPWYMSALFLSQPLHFGDYGGLPLKLIWALLDLIAIGVLGSGLYLWAVRRRQPLEVRLKRLEASAVSKSVQPEL